MQRNMVPGMGKANTKAPNILAWLRLLRDEKEAGFCDVEGREGMVLNIKMGSCHPL